MAAVQAGHPKAEVATLFGVDRNTINRYLRRDAAVRAAWWRETLRLAVADLIFVDETGTNTTLLASLARAGMRPAMLVEGATTTEVVTAYVEHGLAHWLRPDLIVILDRAGSIRLAGPSITVYAMPLRS